MENISLNSTLILRHKPRLERKWIKFFIYTNERKSQHNQQLYVKEITEYFDGKDAVERNCILNTEKYKTLVQNAKDIHIPVLGIQEPTGIMLHYAEYELEVPAENYGQSSLILRWNSVKPIEWYSLTDWFINMINFLDKTLNESNMS